MLEELLEEPLFTYTYVALCLFTWRLRWSTNNASVAGIFDLGGSTSTYTNRTNNMPANPYIRHV